jgi:hypothetical protein
VGYIERHRSVLPPDTSVYADEGTRAHELAAEVLTGRHRLVQSDNADLLIHVRGYLDFVQTKREALGLHRMDVEHKVSLFYLPEQWGTIDVRLTSPHGITIIDLKYGQGVSVQAEGNKQLAIYAESAVAELELLELWPDDTPISLYIYQPRDRNDSEAVRLWRLTRAELREFCRPIQEVAQTILADDPETLAFVPDPEVQCRFCPAQGICKAYAAYGLSVITPEQVDAALDGSLNIPDPASLTREQRIRIIDAADGLRNFLEAVEAQELHDLTIGQPSMGYKIVEGKSNRKWTSDEGAIKVLSAAHPIDEVAPRYPVTPAVALKQYKGDQSLCAALNAIIIKPPGKPTLAPLSDKRPALQVNATEGLERIDLL